MKIDLRGATLRQLPARDADGSLDDSIIYVNLTQKESELPWFVRVCVRCRETFRLAACKNCGGTEYAFCRIAGGGDRIHCKQGDLGVSRWACPACACSNPYALTIRSVKVT